MPAPGRHDGKESGLPIEINATEPAFFSECILAILLCTTFHFYANALFCRMSPRARPGVFLNYTELLVGITTLLMIMRTLEKDAGSRPA